MTGERNMRLSRRGLFGALLGATAMPSVVLAATAPRALKPIGWITCLGPGRYPIIYDDFIPTSAFKMRVSTVYGYTDHRGLFAKTGEG
jgi:hypothetical protein